MLSLRLTALAAALAALSACTLPRTDPTPATQPAAAQAAVKALATAGDTACGVMLPAVPFDSSYTCSSEPRYDRVFGAERFDWGGAPWLAVNYGNEIQLAELADPTRPRPRGRSSFRVGNQGDSDYDLVHVAVCDGCRFGAAWYKLATVVFDLGQGAVPGFVGHHTYSGAVLAAGVTYRHLGRQYLVTPSGLPGSCTGTSTVFEVMGTTDLRPVACVDAGRPVLAAGGEYLDGHVYLADSSTRVYLFRVEPTGALTYLEQPMRAPHGKSDGLAFDAAAGLAIEANNTGMHVWDISDAGHPVKRSTVPGNWSRAAVSWPLAVVAQGGIDSSERAFDLTDPRNPRPVGADFFDGAQTWNDPGHFCSWVEAVVADGAVVQLLRYSRWQVADLAGCVGHVAPPELLFGDGFESGDASAWGGWPP